MPALCVGCQRQSRTYAVVRVYPTHDGPAAELSMTLPFSPQPHPYALGPGPAEQRPPPLSAAGQPSCTRACVMAGGGRALHVREPFKRLSLLVDLRTVAVAVLVLLGLY